MWLLLPTDVIRLVMSGRGEQPRQSLVTHDVEGAQADWRPRHERARRESRPHDIMHVQDILGDGVFKSRRVSGRQAQSKGGRREGGGYALNIDNES